MRAPPSSTAPCGRSSGSRSGPPPPNGDPFGHEALFYRDSASYLAGTVPFVLDALATGSPTLVAVPRGNAELIRRELGRDAERIRLLDMTIDGRNPARIIPAVLSAFFDEHRGRPVAIIGEPIWPGRSDLEYPACVQHEALINTVFAGSDGTILCPYDTRALEPEALADACRTHPMMVSDGARKPSARYTNPATVVSMFNRPLPEPDPSAAVLVFDQVGDLSGVRDFVGRHAAATGLTADRVVDMQIVANEVATNTICHSGGPGAVRVWGDGEYAVCDVTDSGHITDPLVGRIQPPASSEGGRGLLLTNHICDLVRIHTAPGTTTVRLFIRLRVP